MASNIDDESLPCFHIEVFPTGSAESQFNAAHKNNPLSPWQRSQIMQRKGAFNIQCTSIDVVHGKFGTGSPFFASLIVLKFWFDKRRLKRRLLSADISLEFSGMEPEGSRPEVFAISPHDKSALVPTVAHRENSKEMQVNAGVNIYGANAGGSYTWTKTLSEDTSDATTVSGSIDLEGYSYGPPNCASWTLLENETKKTGVPSVLQAAVLLKRETMDPFQCVVDVKARADKVTTFEWLVGSKDHDDPVLFHPSLPATNRLRTYETESLSSLALDSLWDAGLVGSQNPDMQGNSKKQEEKDKSTS
jgi:hypothetical protein